MSYPEEVVKLMKDRFPFRDLRERLAFCDDAGMLIRNTDEITRQEISALSYMVAREKDPLHPGLLEENIKGWPGWRFAHNTFDTREKLSLACGTTLDRVYVELTAKMWTGVPPIEVGTGPCKELKFTGDEVDLTMIPVMLSGEFDSTPHFLSNLLNNRDPETGWQNLANRRIHLKGKNRGVIDLVPGQQDSVIFMKYAMMGKPMPCITMNGVEPLTYICCALKAPAGFAELEFWGAVTGRPLEVVASETHKEIYTPSHAEIVLEGDVHPWERELEGPFSEYMGYYCPLAVRIVNRITTVTMREDPIYYQFYFGVTPSEGDAIGSFVSELAAFKDLRDKLGPLVTAVRALDYGVGMIIQVDKNVIKGIPGIHKHTAPLARITMGPAWNHVAWIVDTDTNIWDDRDILRAMCHKMMGDKDIDFIRYSADSRLHPAARWEFPEDDTLCCFTIMDCTEPPPPHDMWYRRGQALPPRAALEEMEKKYPNIYKKK